MTKVQKKFITQQRHKGRVDLRFTDLRGTCFALRVCQHPAEEGLLALCEFSEDFTVVALLERHQAAELAQALQRYSETGTLAPKPDRRHRTVCPRCGKKQMYRVGEWEEQGVHFCSQRCEAKGCRFQQGPICLEGENVATMPVTHELLGEHYEADRWLHQDQDFYYCYSTMEPWIKIGYKPSFDRWANSSDRWVYLWHWQVDFFLLHRFLMETLEQGEKFDFNHLEIDVTQRYQEYAAANGAKS